MSSGTKSWSRVRTFLPLIRDEPRADEGVQDLQRLVVPDLAVLADLEDAPLAVDEIDHVRLVGLEQPRGSGHVASEHERALGIASRHRPVGVHPPHALQDQARSRPGRR